MTSCYRFSLPNACVGSAIAMLRLLEFRTCADRSCKHTTATPWHWQGSTGNT